MTQEAEMTPSCQEVSLKDGVHNMICTVTNNTSGHFLYYTYYYTL